MSNVVCAVEPTINAAYQASREEIDVSITSVYNKLNDLETSISAAMVEYSGEAMAPVVHELNAELDPLLAGFRTKILDGTCIEASEHRIEELRRESAGALPGKTLAVFDPQLKLVTDVFPCEDGHAQERRLLGQVLDRAVEAGQLWIADRNFSTQGFLMGIDERGARFLIREHGNLPWEAVGEPERPAGRTGSGTLHAQRVRICSEGREVIARQVIARRIRLELQEPTRDGDTEIAVLTNLFAEEASATAVAQLYRQRWQIEHAFQDLTEHLEGEADTLGYPKAALFGLMVGFVAYNVMSVIGAALRSAHGSQKVEKEVSGYYIAVELSNTYRGLMIAIPPQRWALLLADVSGAEELAALLRKLAAEASLACYQKHPRGPKKPSPQRRSSKRKPHVSTAKLIATRKG